MATLATAGNAAVARHLLQGLLQVAPGLDARHVRAEAATEIARIARVALIVARQHPQASVVGTMPTSRTVNSRSL